MTARALGAALATELHRSHLRPAGFRKKGATFSRPRQGYIELFNIQGSDWNSGEEPWRFYLNARVCFSDLGPLNGGKLTAQYFHAEGRSNRLLPGTPPHFDVSQQTVEQVARELATLILRMSEALPALLKPVRSRALAGLYSPLPLPDTWQDGPAT